MPARLPPGPVRHVYVHVPFCPTICPFCDFHVVERRRGLVDAYLAELARDADEQAPLLGGRPPASVYLGGGTPSHLRPDELARLVASLERAFGGPASEETTLEIHPSTASPDRVASWCELDIDRLSVGVQSPDDAVLRTLGRPHDGAAALRALDLALEALADGRVRTVSADVITAVPGQDPARDLDLVAATGVPHVSAYTLTIEPGTPFGRSGFSVDPDDEGRALAAATEVLGGHGLRRYEVSSHARPGHEARHNAAYWRNDWWLGLGPGAAAHHPGRAEEEDEVARRRTNPPLDRWLQGERGEWHPVTAEGFVREGILAGLRPLAGVDLAGLGARAGIDALALLADPLTDLLGRGLVELDGTLLRATDAGRLILDRVTAELL